MPSALAPAALTRSKAVSIWSSRRKSPFHPMIAARSRRSPAVGRPGISDVGVAGEDENAGGVQHLQGRQSETAGAMGDQRNAGLGHHFRRGRGLLFGDVAEAETVANRDLAAQAQRACPGTDLLDIEEAHLAGLVQVDVEPDTVPRGDRKDAVELPLGIAIDL